MNDPLLPNRANNISPVSAAGSEWSGVNAYASGINRSESPYSPVSGNRGPFVTPPQTGNGQPPPMNGGYGGPPGRRRPSEGPGTGPSPPSSIAPSRASDGTLSDQQSRKYKKMEESLLQHYNVLKRFLATTSSQKPPRQNKAQDKLLRLSPVQFHELSTDVFDELQRRQAATPPLPPPPGQPPRPPPNVPPFLLPRQDFHEKRNQARKKLASLQEGRFRDLATDVFTELQRRFPKFAGMDMDRRNSPGPGMRGPPSRGPTPNGMRPPRGPPGPNGYPPPGPNGYAGPGPNGMVPPPRSQSRGPPGRPGPPGSGYGPSPPPADGYGPPGNRRFPPRQGSLGGQAGGLGIQDSNSPVSPESDYGQPLPKQFQSNTIIPNKSTMVEDDDDLGDAYDRRSDAFGLDGAASSIASRRETSATSQSAASSNRDAKALADAQAQLADLKERTEELEGNLRSKDKEIMRLESAALDKSGESDEWLQVRADLEKKLEDAEMLNQSMQDQLDRMQADQANTERDLRAQLDSAKRSNPGEGQWKNKYDRLEREHEDLELQLEDQRKVTEEVRKEASVFLSEMRSMAENGGGNWEREEKLTRDVARLEEEVKEWKSRYARSKAQVRNLRASSIGLPMARMDTSRLAKDTDFSRPDGLVKDVHVTKFQIAIDELLRVARAGEPSAVLEYMKSVVMTVRQLTQDLDTAHADKDDEGAQRRGRLKAKVSATANNIITASKNFASSNGISPVSLLDAAASHLTSAVVELCRSVKIRPTPSDELEEDNEDSLEPLQSPGYFSITPSTRRVSGNESVYSAVSSPPSVVAKSVAETMAHRRSASRNGALPNGKFGTGVKLGFGMRGQDSDLEELKLYLEDQTDSLVRSIQGLVAAIRAEEPLPTIRSQMATIANVVGKVVSATESSMRDPSSSPALRDRAEPIVQNLGECKNRLLNAAEESNRLDGASAKNFTNQLPPLAFEIARETKELVQRIERIDFVEDEDDFN
ncbi:MAG: hypothetical protein Q9227_000075 [Pyrenula ochraceoflavens]